jgi:hypothetical protein
MEHNLSTYEVNLASLQPTQFYLCLRKFQEVVVSFNPCLLRPFAVRTISGRLSLTDGHHTAVLAWLMGIKTVSAWYDTDAMDWDAYTVCVAECQRHGVFTIPDLAGRMVTDEIYERDWLKWCAGIH